jgi:hypothetical protein
MTAVPLRCSYCPDGTSAEGAELAMVGFHEQSSGAGWTYYACEPCRKENGLTPLTKTRYTIGDVFGTTLTCATTLAVLAWLATR